MAIACAVCRGINALARTTRRHGWRNDAAISLVVPPSASRMAGTIRCIGGIASDRAARLQPVGFRATDAASNRTRQMKIFNPNATSRYPGNKYASTGSLAVVTFHPFSCWIVNCGVPEFWGFGMKSRALEKSLR